MRLEQAIVYVLANAGHGMTTIAIAQAINEEMLYVRNDGKPVNTERYLGPEITLLPQLMGSKKLDVKMRKLP